MRHLPNLITVLRLLLVVPTGFAILDGRFELAFVLFLAAGVSDGIDGALARRFAWTSRFGAIADPLADKLLVAVVYVLLAIDGALPVWLAVLVLGRDLLIIGGALCYHLLIDRLEMAPTRLGKANTLLHILFVGTVLAGLAGLLPAQLVALLPGGIVLITVMTLVSGADYVLTWSDRARVGRERGAAPK